MRRFLFFALVGLAAPAHAQGAPPRAPTGGERAALVASALAGAAVALPTGPFLIVGAGVRTYAASALLDLDPTVGGVLIDTAVGAGVAVAVGGGTLWLVTEAGGADPDLSASIGSVFVGLAAGSAAVGAVHGARLAWLRADAVGVAPTALAVPGGGPSPGLSFSVSL